MFNRRHLMLAAAAALASAGAAGAQEAGPVIGQPPPTFSAPDADGTDAFAEPVPGEDGVLEWTNHDCPYVKKH